MNTPNIGHIIIDKDTQRDAIHFAVMPVIAGSRLEGWIRWDKRQNGLAVQSSPKDAVGIVDPFLREEVNAGQRFWLFLLPNTITSLRHEWTHPAIDKQPAVIEPSEIEKSRAWIAQFAADLDQTPSRLMEAARDYAECGEYAYDNSETYKSFRDRFPEFWRHYEIVTGKPVKDKDCPYTCSC